MKAIRRATLTLLAAVCSLLLAQQPITFQYFYDDRNQLAKVVDSTGIVIEYIYDGVGNILEVKRSTLSSPGATSVFNFTPQQGGPSTVVTIQGQGFGTSPVVRFNGVPATVLPNPTSNSLQAVVPLTATTGTITVTVGTTTATSSAAFTVLQTPVVTAVTPKYSLPGAAVSGFSVTGLNLNGSTFSFAPVLNPIGINVSAVIINPGGTSATMNLAVSANAVGTFTLIATKPTGTSDPFPSVANSIQILNPNADEDRDGLTNGQEGARGTDPFNPDTDGDVYPDGVEVEAGSDPLNPASTPVTANPIMEAVSASLAALNTADPSLAPSPDPAVSIKEAISAALSALNTADPSQAPSPAPAVSIREAVSASHAVLNTADPSTGATPDPSVVIKEAVGASFALLNTADPSTDVSPDPSVVIKEAVGASFTLLNTADPSTGSSPDPSVTIAEAVGASFAVLNTADPSQATTPDPSVSIREAISAAFSMLNTADPSTATSPDPAVSIRESVSPQFSVQNTATSNTSSSVLAPGASGAAQDSRATAAPENTVEIVFPKPGSILMEGQTLDVLAAVPAGEDFESVEIFVNDVLFHVDRSAPYSLRFTVPSGPRSLAFRAHAIGRDGNRWRSGPVTVAIVNDPAAEVRGVVVDETGAPMAGATVTAAPQGLTAEFFDMETPLFSLPVLTGRQPAARKLVSAINMRDPNQMFGGDPFGVRLGPDYAARFSGFVLIPAAGEYTFIVGVDEGARLRIGGRTVAEIREGKGEFTEVTGAVRLEPGWIPIEVLYYESIGDAELQLSWIPPGGELEVIPVSAFAAGEAIVVQSDESGQFSLRVPAIVEGLTVGVRVLRDGVRSRSEGILIRPLAGGVIEAGSIQVLKEAVQ